MTNIRLRSREFALLWSVGMSKRNISKMLTVESVLSSVRALMIGIPLGTALIFLLYVGFMQIGSITFSYPWTAVMMSAIGIFAITFGVTKFAQRRANQLSVIDALREE
jgi:putative ABC transport system permease protein